MTMPLRSFIFISLLFAPLAAVAAELFVEPAWLAQRLDKPGIVIVDMSNEPQYQRFHIPGARQLPVHLLSRRTRSGVSFSIGSENVVRLLGQLGIRRSDHVVIYDDMGGLNAGRLLWELDRIGHARVSILNGGLVSWVLEGRKVSNRPASYKPVNYGRPGKGREGVLATLDDIRAWLKDDGGEVLLDVRSREEYIGNPRFPRSGHIPGARWWEWSNSVDFENAFRHRPAAALRAELAKLGLRDPATPVTLYCRSGHRAAQSYLTLRALGFERVRVYDGSMLEYERQRSLPLKKGPDS